MGAPPPRPDESLPGDATSDPDGTRRKDRVVWGVLSPEELSRPGAVLLALIFQAAHLRNLRPQEVCDELKISNSYFGGLRSGVKPIPNIGDDLIERISQFLRIPKLVVKLAAGQLKVEDFYYVGEHIHSYIPPALRFIQADPEYGPVMPMSVFSVDVDLQLFIVSLYEKASGKTVLPPRVEPGTVVQRFETLLGSLKDSTP